MSANRLAALVHDPLPASFREDLARLVGRRVEVVTNHTKNAAVRATEADYCVFLDVSDPLDSSFLEQACRLLDRNADAEIVTSWLEGVPLAHDVRERRVDVVALLARPWFVHVPSVFRRATWQRLGGFDESLAAAADVDFLLRVVAGGGSVVGIAEARLRDSAWGERFDWESEHAVDVARRLYEKHRALFEAHWEAVLIGKERIIRELYAVRAPLDDRVRVLHSELARLERDLDELRSNWSSLEP